MRITEEPKTTRHPLSILVVEDDEPVRRSLAGFLSDRYETVVEAANGKEAFDWLCQRTFDAAITDIRMPHLDGIGLLKEIHKNYPAVETIVVTGYADIDTAIEASRHRAFDYIRKPYDLIQVDATLRKILAKKQAAEQTERERMRIVARDRFLALGALTTSIMHEINNPNAVIFGGVELIRNRFLAPLAASELQNEIDAVAGYSLAQVTRSLQAVKKASERIDDLVRRVSSIAGGQLNVPRVADLRENVDAVLLSLGSERTKNILVVSPTSGPASMVKAYPEEVRQVASILIENALEAVADVPDPSIRVEFGTDECGTLAIEDNGLGDLKPLDRIFDPFVTTKRDRPGRGLGLFIVRQIMDQLGGAVHAEPVSTGGLRFTAVWPVSPETGA